jgi:zinc protease
MQKNCSAKTNIEMDKNHKPIDRTVAPPIKDFDDLRLDYPKPTALPNGVPMYVVSGGDQEVFKIELVYRGGEFAQDKKLEATMAVDMLQFGSEKYDQKAISETLDFYGASFDAESHLGYVIVSIKALNRCLDGVMPVFTDIVLHPSYPENHFEILKENKKDSIRTSERKTSVIARKAMVREYLGKGHPMAETATEKDVDDLTTDDLRRYHSKFCHTANLTIILSGLITEEIKQSVIKYFGTTADGAKELEIAMIPPLLSGKKFVVTDCKDSVQASLIMRIPTITRKHPDFLKLHVLCIVLGGYPGSRLMMNVREQKGYTYHIQASLCGNLNHSFISVTAEIDTKHTAEVISEVKAEMQRLREELIPDEELKVACSYTMGMIASTIDNPFSIGVHVGSMIVFGGYPEYFNKKVEEINNASAENLREIARKYLKDEDIFISVAGAKSIMKL